MTRSLTARVLLGTVIWILVAIWAGGYAVYDVFRESAVRQFDHRLEEEMDLLIAAVAFRPDDPAARMTSPAFQRIFSGAYWQATQEDTELRSRSLQGFPLPTVATEEESVEAEGPDGQRLRYIATEITTPNGAVWTLTVASDATLLEEDQQTIQRSMWIAAALMSLALIAAAVLFLWLALRQLRFLRDTVRSLSTEATGRDPESFPTEIAPLVADLNTAFDKNVRMRERGEVLAANLAHALKTPAAVLRNEIERTANGQAMDVSVAKAAIDQISTTADIHLHTSVAGQDALTRAGQTDAAQNLRNLVSATSRLFPHLRFEVAAPDRLDITMTENAFQEILGNLVENAGKWAASKVSVSLAVQNTVAVLKVEDDGPGVPEDQRQNVLRQHVRLDEGKPGTGLGLSIVADLVDTFGGDISLHRSDLGGLCAEIRLNLPDLKAS